MGAGGGGGTPIPYLYGYVPPNGVVILKLLIKNGVSISEVFSRTGYIISNGRKLQFGKQPFEIIQGHIAFKNTVQFTIFLERRQKNWPLSRVGYQFQGEFYNGVSILGQIFFRTGCQFGVPGGTYPPQKYPSVGARGWGDSHKKKTGMLVRNFELKP